MTSLPPPDRDSGPHAPLHAPRATGVPATMATAEVDGWPISPPPAVPVDGQRTGTVPRTVPGAVPDMPAAAPTGAFLLGTAGARWQQREAPGAGDTVAPGPWRPALSTHDRAAIRALREEVRQAVGKLLDERQLFTPGAEDEQKIRVLIHEHVAAYQRRAAATNTRRLDDPEGVAQRLFDGLLRLGVLQPLLDAPGIEEVICNGPGRTFVVEDGRKRLVPDVVFDDDDELRALIKRLIGPLGKRLDESSPMVDARLPDGSRLNAVIPPASARWTCLTIRKFLLRAQSLEELCALGTLPESAAHFLDAAVQAGVNMLVSGPTGSGKTTFLNALGSSIADGNERIVVIEETPELQLDRHLPDCVTLQARPPNLEGVGEIRIRDLVRNALRMRPSRIVIGEVRGAEALDMLLALNTGHEGSLCTIHGNGPRDALDRLAMLASMAEERLASDALTKMVARSIELVVQLRFVPRTGHRRVVSIFEVGGLDGDVLTGHELWALDPTTDHLQWTGIQPRCLAKLRAKSIPYTLPPVAARPAVRIGRPGGEE